MFQEGSSVLFANDVVLLSLSGGGLQFELEWFAAVGMRISTSKSGAIVHSWKRMERSLQVRDQMLLQTEAFVYTGSCSYMRREVRDGQMDQDGVCMDVDAVYHSIVVSREQSTNVKLSICCSICVPHMVTSSG